MDEELMLDGNSLAGLLGEVFAAEMTAARGECASCGATEPFGAQHVYAHAPGAVVRCSHCEGVLMVVVHRNESYVLGFQGLRWLEMRP